MKNRKWTTWALVAALVLCLASVTFGQERAGTIQGTVSDASGAKVPGATVVITSVSGTGVAGITPGPSTTSGFTRTITTDSDGFYSAPEVPPGFYTVSTTATNFAPARIEQVEVVLGRATPINFALEAGGVGAVVNVSGADALAIDTTDNKVQTNITQTVIANTPKGVNFSSLLQVAPGLRAEPKSGEFQVDGASGSENTFIIDGQEVTNFRTGTLATGNGTANNNLPFQFIQEVQVKTNGTEAEFGGALGGVINVVTKGGNNDFHGEFGMSFRPSKLSAGPRPILGADQSNLFFIRPTRDTGLGTFPTAVLSGPIIKNRLFFLADYTPQLFVTRRTFNFGPGSGFAPGSSSPTFRQEIKQDYTFFRLDGNITEKLRVFGTYTYNPTKINGLIPTNTTLSNTGPVGVTTLSPDVQFAQGGRVASQDYTIEGVYTPTSRLAFTLRQGRSYLNEKGSGNFGVLNVVNTRCIRNDPNGSCRAGFSTIPVGANNFVAKDISIRTTIDGNGSFLFNAGGRHQLKGGFQRNRLFNDVSNGNFGTGEVRLFYGGTIADTTGAQRGAGPGEAGYGYLQRFGTNGIAGSTNLGLYVQDQYQPFSRLTLNLGIRTEREDVPSFSPTAVGIKFNFADKIAPRLGFAFDPTGKGKLKIFGFFGRFYDRFKYELPRGSFGGDQFLRDYFVISSANTNFTRYTRDFALANKFRTADFRVPSNSASDFRVDPNLKAIRQTEYTFGSEYEISNGFVVGGRFTRKNIDRTIEDVGISDASGNEIFFIFNPGFGQSTTSLIPNVPGTPKAVRRYTGLEFKVDKRFSQNFNVNASYTYSRLFGNYSGLASSDENGRTSPSVNRDFDEPFEKFTPNGVPALGLLPTDRPHVVKIFSGYTLNYKKLFGGGEFVGNNDTTFKGSFFGESGTPVTSRVSLLGVDSTVLFGRGDLGRTGKFYQTDLGLTHRYRFGNDNRLAVAFDIDVLNALNNNSELGRFELITSNDFSGTTLGGTTPVSNVQRIFNGGVLTNIQKNLGTAAFPVDARYNKTNIFQNPRSVRFGFRFNF